MAAQPRRATTYIEPFAGGAGVGLKLLYDERVDDVVLNDLDPGVAAFWRVVFQRTDEFVALIETTGVNVDEWHSQRALHTAPAHGDDLTLGFATFFSTGPTALGS